MINVKIAKKPKNTGSSQGARTNGLQVSSPTGNTEKAGYAEKAGYPSEAGHASQSDYAKDFAPTSDAAQRELSRKTADTAEGHITFDAGATVHNGIDISGDAAVHDDLQLDKGYKADGPAQNNGGATFGHYTEGATGGKVDAAGNGEFQSLKVRGALSIYELVYNRINATDSVAMATDSGEIESVT